MAAWKAFLLLLPIFAVIDLVYLGVIMRSFYDHEFGSLARRAGVCHCGRENRQPLSPANWGGIRQECLAMPRKDR